MAHGGPRFNFHATPQNSDLGTIITKIITRDKRPPKEKWLGAAVNLVIAQGTLQPLFREVVGVPHLASNHIMVWKALGLIHRVCQDVGEGILTECVDDAVNSINFLRRLCGDHDTDLYSKASGLLAQVLLSKVETHRKIPGLNGLWVSDRGPQQLYADHKEDLLDALMELQQLFITCCSVVTGMAGTVATRRKQSEYEYRRNACLLWPLISIITESVNIYCLMQELINAKLHQGEDVWNDVRRFYDQHNKLRGIYHSARQVPFLAARVVTLVLPAQPPIFDITAPLARPDQDAPSDADIALAAQLGDDLFARNDASPAMPRRGDWRGGKAGPSNHKAGSRLAVPYPSGEKPRSESEASRRSQEQELEDLKVQVASLESYVSELTKVDPDAAASMEAEVNRAHESRAQIETLTQQLEQLQDELHELQSSRIDLETESATREQDLQGQLREAQQNYQNAKASLQSMEAVNSDLQQAADQAAEDAERQQEENAQLLELVDRLNGALQSHEGQRSEILAEMQEMEETITSFKEKNASLEERLAERAEQHSFVLENLNEKLQIVASQLHSKQMESELLERRQASSLVATEAAEAARAEMEQQLVCRQEELDVAHKKAVLCMEQMVAAQDDRMKTHQEKLVLHDRCEVAEAEVTALQKRVESQYEELRHLQAAQVEARQLSEIKTRSLQAELALAEKSRLKAMQEDENISQQAEALQRQAMELRESLNAAEAAKASASEKNEDLSSQLVKAQQEREALEARVATLTTSVEELRSSRDAEASEHADTLQQLRDQIAASQSSQEELRQQLIEARAMGVKSAAELQTTKDEARIREGEDAERLKRAETELTTLRQEVEKVAVSSTRRLEQMTSENERRQKALREEMEQQSEAHREAEARIWRDARAAVVGALASALRLPSSEPAIDTLLKGCRKQLASLKGHDTDGRALGTAVDAASVLSQASWAVRQLASLTQDNSAVASVQEKTLANCAEAEEATASAISALLHEGGTEQMPEADRDAALQAADATLAKLMDSAAELEQSVGALGSQLTEQLEEASNSVCEAQRRMEAMLAEARKALDKKTLAVHEGMLEQATALMALIQRLIHSSGALQQEIVAQEAASGKGVLNTARFYKRNSRWVEGLLSAAKAVGGAAKATVDAADHALADKGKLEVMMVCGQEIAASTAQLVSASRVKARQESKQKAVLEKDANEVQEATRRLIDVVREACLKNKAPQRAGDFLKLSLVQAKRLQMDSQVRTLELESALHREQDRLRQLRRASYQLSERADVDGGDEDSEPEDGDGDLAV